MARCDEREEGTRDEKNRLIIMTLHSADMCVCVCVCIYVCMSTFPHLFPLMFLFSSYGAIYGDYEY